MYATNLYDQLINAALPLKPLTVWTGGACTVTVAVPPAQSLAGVAIDSVSVELTLPSGAVASVNGVKVEGSPNWAATFPAELFATSGFVAEGFVVRLGGTDERSAQRMWIVSKGDLEIKPGDASPSPSGSYVLIHLRDSAPDAPVKGDAYISGGALYVYDGTAWQTIGGGGDKLDSTAAYPAWEQDVEYSLGEIVSYQGGLYRCIGAGNRGWPPLGTDVSPYVWQPYTVKDVIAVLAANMSYARHGVTLTDGAGTLLDRTSNCVVASAATTLTHPAALADGKLRDYLVRLELLGSSVPTITFAAPTGETIVYETDGDEFPVPDDTGSWLYSFTESDASKFAVSLKKLNEVAQGGA